MTACPICEKHRGEGPLVAPVLHRDSLVVASHAPVLEQDAYLGYIYIETCRHAAGLHDLTNAEAARLGVVVTALARAVMEETDAEVVYSWVYNHTPHHHVHVVPRHPDTPSEYWLNAVVEWPDAPRGDSETVEALSERIRARLDVPELPAA